MQDCLARAALVVAVALVAVAPTSWARDPTYKDEQLLTAKTQQGVQIKALVMVPDKPRAVAIVFPEGSGSMNLGGSSAMVTMNWLGQYDFLVRARKYFFQRDVAFVAIDSPDGKEMTAADRERAGAAVKAMLDLVRAQSKPVSSRPVWVIGTDAGTISAAAFAAQYPKLIDGIVLASPVTRPGATFADWGAQNTQGLASMELDKIDKPVLVIVDSDDKCAYSPPAEAKMLLDKFVRSQRKEVKSMSGGNPNGDACAANSPHGFWDIESETVQAVVSYMTHKK